MITFPGRFCPSAGCGGGGAGRPRAGTVGGAPPVWGALRAATGGGATAIKIAASIDSAEKSADTSSAADSFFGTFWDVFFWDFFGLF